MIPLLESALGDSEVKHRQLLFALVLLGYTGQSAQADLSNSDILEALRARGAHYRTGLFTDFDFELLSEHSKPISALYQQLRPICAHMSVDTLGFLYERLLNHTKIKNEGVIYTPPEVVKFMVASSINAVRERSPNLPISILDPACGSGLFLLEGLRFLANAYPEVEKTWIIQHCLFGADKDPKAVQLAQLSLQLELERDTQLPLFAQKQVLDLSSNFACGNSLISPELVGEIDRDSAKELGAIDFKVSFPAIMSQGGFDCVVGNPPYGLSREERLSAQENSLLKQLYEEYRHGKVNKYQLFITKGYELLRKGGEISLIVPNSWLGIESARNLRKLLVSEGALHHIYINEYNVFPEIAVETVVFQATKVGGYPSFDIQRVGLGFSIKDGSLVQVPITSCNEENAWRIPLHWSTEHNQVLEHLAQHAVPLESEQFGFTAMIALQAYAAGRGMPPQTLEHSETRAFHNREKLTEDHIPYLEGKDIGRYALSWSGEYLHHGPWLAEPQQPERFQGPRIVLREILGPRPNIVQATYVDEPYFYNKSVLHILIAGEAAKERAYALLAVLNSKLTSFQILVNGRKSQRRVFPKILCSDLKNLFLPNDFDRYVPDLARLCEQRLSTTDPRKGAGIETEIDTLVFGAYQLKNSDVEAVEGLLSRAGR